MPGVRIGSLSIQFGMGCPVKAEDASEAITSEEGYKSRFRSRDGFSSWLKQLVEVFVNQLSLVRRVSRRVNVRRAVRVAPVVLGLAGILGLTFAAVQLPSAPKAQAASSPMISQQGYYRNDAWLAHLRPRPINNPVEFTYQRGFYLQNGWLCYGWANGAYHCTQAWHRSNGQLVSDNTAWVPANGNSGSGGGQSAPPTHYGPPAPPPAPSGSVQGMIVSIFGSYAGAALAVARCESGYNPGAYNASSGASGVFQFLPSTWVTTAYAGYSPFNAWANISAAHQVFVRDGYSWREWVCQP